MVPDQASLMNEKEIVSTVVTVSRLIKDIDREISSLWMFICVTGQLIFDLLVDWPKFLYFLKNPGPTISSFIIYLLFDVGPRFKRKYCGT